MPARRNRAEMIVRVLQAHAAGGKLANLCPEYGISEGTFYRWKAKYGGMTISDVRRFMALEDEERRAKRSYPPTPRWISRP